MRPTALNVCMTPQKLLEFHDAEVDDIGFDDGNVTVRFSKAFAYSSWDSAHVDLDSGRYYPAVLRLAAGTISGDRPSFDEDSYLSTGDVLVDGVTFSGVIAVPLETIGDVQIVLTFVTGDVIKISGKALTIQLFDNTTTVPE